MYENKIMPTGYLCYVSQILNIDHTWMHQGIECSAAVQR